MKQDREIRALAGLSMGAARRSISAWVISTHLPGSAGSPLPPNTRAPERLVPNPSTAARDLKLLWVSCGDQDVIINISQQLHPFLKEKNVRHIWHVDSGAHSWPVWKNDLYLFSQRILH